MCKYCKNAKTGNDLEFIFTKNISLGAFGKISFESYISNEGKLNVEVDGIAPDGTFISNRPMMCKEINIKFCPFCGEKL